MNTKASRPRSFHPEKIIGGARYLASTGYGCKLAKAEHNTAVGISHLSHDLLATTALPGLSTLLTGLSFILHVLII